MGKYSKADTSGMVPASQLGSGTADSTKTLRGDRAWTVPSGGVTLPIAESDVTNLTVDLAAKCAITDSRLSDARTPLTHTHAQTDVTGLVSALAAKEVSANKGIASGYASLDGSVKIPIAQIPTGSTATTTCIGNDSRLSDARTPLAHTHAESEVTNLVSDLAAKAPLASPTFTGTPVAPTAGAGTNTTQLASTAYAMSCAPNSSYRTILDCSGSHTAARVAGTYAMGQGDPLAISGTGTLYPLNTIFIASADYPTVNGLAPKLRIRAQLYTNDVAPFVGTFIVGFYPITRPSVSGGAGLCIYTLGTVVAGSTLTFTNVAADSSNGTAGSDFALPSDGHYVLGVLTNGTMASSSHVHIVAQLQMRNG